MEEFFQVISNFGFPVAVASYLLFRFEKKLEILEETNEQLVDKVAELRAIIVSLKRTVVKLKGDK